MQAISFPGYGRVELIELPRPALRDPGDAIVLVTTAAIGPWDIERFLSIGEDPIVPGGEFAGLVVETGESVTNVAIDDLVSNTVQNTSGNGQSRLFGSGSLPGGHAEYVRVPDADTTLTVIADSGEERALLAGGTVGLGVNAATAAFLDTPENTYAVVGCDPIGMTALISLKNKNAADRTIAIEDHDARRTLADGFAGSTFTSTDDFPANQSDVVIVGSIREYPGFETVIRAVKPGGTIIFSEPYSPARLVEAGIALPQGITISAATWPTTQEVKKIVTEIQIRRLELTPLVSHMYPFDEAQDAYEAAAGPGTGVQKVLLKP